MMIIIIMMISSLYYSLFKIRAPSHLNENWFLLRMYPFHQERCSMPMRYDAVIRSELYYHTFLLTPRYISTLNNKFFFFFFF
jgi:hypothetical protein